MYELHQFTLDTPRLIVRPYTLDDLDAVQAVVNSAFGDGPLEARHEWLTWQIMNYTALARLAQPPYGDRAVVHKASGRVIGSVGVVQSYGPFEKLPWFQRRLRTPITRYSTPEMGLFWAMHADFRGQGYALEAAQTLVEFLFTRWGTARVVATTEYDNAASIRVMEKLGMTVERNPGSEPPWFQVVGILENLR